MAEKYLNRKIDSELIHWKEEENRKPLWLHGARQVGKSSSVRKLVENFDHFVEINFEKNRKVHGYFADDPDVKEICANLAVQFKKPIVPNRTLLFLDEIQACPDAISALRFFYKDYPELHAPVSQRKTIGIRYPHFA